MQAKKFILKYIRLLKTLGITNLRVIGFDDNNRIYDIIEADGWLRDNNQLMTFAVKGIDLWFDKCTYLKIESIDHCIYFYCNIEELSY